MKKIAITLGAILCLCAKTVKSQDLIDSINETFAGVNSICVKGVFCKVEFEDGGSATVHVEGEIRSTNRNKDSRIGYKQTGEHLDVWIDHPINLRGRTNGFLHFVAPKNVKIMVENVSGSVSVVGIGRETLSVDNVSGSINVKDIPCKAELKSVSGSIKANFIDGDLLAKTISGSINVVDVKGAAELKSVSGTASAQAVVDKLNISTISGSLNIGEVYSDIAAKSTSGRIELKDVKGNITVSAVSGSIKLTSTIGSIKASSGSGSINGSEVMVTDNSNFKTTSGSIDIALLNTPKSLSYELSSVSGRLEANGINGKGELDITEGSVKITGNSVSGSMKFY